MSPMLPGRFPAAGGSAPESEAPVAPAGTSPAPQSPEEESQETGEPPFTDDQAEYHGPEEVCDNCDYFQPPDACIWVQGPKDPQGHCALHSARASSGEGIGMNPGGMNPRPGH